jgi:hypothetical protein
MSYFDDASLVMIPSGYKDQKVYSVKPIDGSGDLTFTRSNDTATRVASNGLIEKVRTNLILQSQTLDNASWDKSDATVTANTTIAPDGTLTADTITAVVIDQRVNQAVTVAASTEHTFSFFAKKGTTVTPRYSVYDLSNNAFILTQVDYSALVNTSTWSRITATFTTPAGCTSISIYPINAATLGTTFIWGCQLETGVATDYIATTSAAVSVGPVANLPRLDYSGGATCPKLLLEPQRVNLAQFSESFNNAYWTQNATVTANSTISPSGYQDADTLTDASNSYLDVRRSFTITASTAYTFSTFVKKTTGTLTNYAGIGFSGGGGVETGYAIFNTTTGVVNLADIAGGFVLSAKSTSYGDYYRFEMTFTTGQTSLLVLIYPALSQNGTTLSSDAQGSNVFWGAQLEAGAYATSYIPTLGAAVTRGADAASKTGISSLIGQTEGTLFLDFVAQTTTTAQSHIWLGAAGSEIGVYGPSSFVFYSSGGVSINGGAFVTGQRYKIAFGYKANDYVVYVNGVQKGTDTSATVPAMSALYINSYSDFTETQKRDVNQVLLFPTRLSNADLAALTA